MILQETTLQIENSILPTQLDFYRILAIRGFDYFEREKKLCKSLEAGEEGEKILLKYLKEHGNRNWTVLRNVWLDERGSFECDIILITNHAVYVFEVKNYKGTFSYDNGLCKVGNIEIPNNPIEQARRAYVKVKNICAQLPFNVPVKGALIFVGTDNEVKIHTPVNNIEIIQRNQLINFIREIVAVGNNSYNQQIEPATIISHLEQSEVTNRFAPEPLLKKEMKHIQGGVYCANCHSFDVEIHRHSVECSCGLIESREEASIRTICDYGVLYFDQQLTRKALLHFFDGQVALTHFLTVINKHFKIIKKNKYTYYENRRLPFYKIINTFDIKKPKILYLDADMPIIINQLYNEHPSPDAYKLVSRLFT